MDKWLDALAGTVYATSAASFDLASMFDWARTFDVRFDYNSSFIDMNFTTITI